jgi:high-affinity iron transporter
MDFVSRILEGLVVSLREGIEVALVVGILLAYLVRTGRAAYRPYVLGGLGAALAASLSLAVVVRRVGVDADNPLVEGILMLVAAALVTSLLIWMWRVGRHMRRRLEERLDTLVGSGPSDQVRWAAAAGVFGFAFLMVLREGVETVLFLLALASAGDAAPLATGLGAAAGLVLAVLYGLFLAQSPVRQHLAQFFRITGIVLALLVVKLVAGGLHEFFEAGLLPSMSLLEGVVEVLTHRIVSWGILILLVATPLMFVLWTRRSSSPTPVHPS